MRPLAVLLFIVSLCGMHAAEAMGSPPPFWPDAVDTIEVVSPRPFPEERMGRTPGFVQVVRLGPAVPASCDLADLLDRAAGVQIRSYGGSGSIQLASVRGSSPSQVEVRVDDAPISAGPDGMVDLSFLPARLFERAEIARGPGASEEAGLGLGVIRLRTRQDAGAPLHLRVGAGSFGASTLAAAGGLARGALAILVSGGVVASEGDYPYRDRNGTPYEGGDDRTVRRENNAFRQSDALVQGRYRAGERLAASYIGHGLWRDAGVPGTESMQTRNVRDRFRRLLQVVALDARGPSSSAWKLLLHRQEDADHYENPDGEVGLGKSDTKSDFLAQGGEIRATSLLPGIGATLRVAGSLQEEIWRGRDLLAGRAEPAHRRLAGGLGLDLAARPIAAVELLLRERLLVSTGRGSEGVRLRTPRVGVSLDAGRGILIRGGLGRFARLPAFVEMHGRGGVQIGNPALAAERGTAWDLGASARMPGRSHGPLRCRVEAAYFESRTEEAIVWLQNSQRTSRPENLERTRVRGAELLARAAYSARSVPSWAHPAIDVTASGTLQEARDAGPSASYRGKSLPYLPNAKGSIQTGIALSRLRLEHALDYESGFYRDRYNSQARRRGDRFLQEARVVFSMKRESLELLLGARNIADVRTQDVEGFPLPGRSFFLELAYSAPAGGGADDATAGRGEGDRQPRP